MNMQLSISFNQKLSANTDKVNMPSKHTHCCVVLAILNCPKITIFSSPGKRHRDHADNTLSQPFPTRLKARPPALSLAKLLGLKTSSKAIPGFHRNFQNGL